MVAALEETFELEGPSKQAENNFGYHSQSSRVGRVEVLLARALESGIASRPEGLIFELVLANFQVISSLYRREAHSLAVPFSISPWHTHIVC